VKLKERLDALGVRCELVHGGNGDTGHMLPNDFLFSMLGVGETGRTSLPTGK
jgi:hypothetical protein